MFTTTLPLQTVLDGMSKNMSLSAKLDHLCNSPEIRIFSTDAKGRQSTRRRLRVSDRNDCFPFAGTYVGHFIYCKYNYLTHIDEVLINVAWMDHGIYLLPIAVLSVEITLH